MLITDLPTDLLRHVAVFLVRSQDGPRNFSRARAVSKQILEVVESEEVLKAMKFDGQIKPSYRDGFYGHVNGLFYQCACAGNISAQYLLAKEILKSMKMINSCRGKSRGFIQASFFISRFTFDGNTKVPARTDSRRMFVHPGEIMRTYIANCLPQEVVDNCVDLCVVYPIYCKRSIFSVEMLNTLFLSMMRLTQNALAIVRLKKILSSAYQVDKLRDLDLRVIDPDEETRIRLIKVYSSDIKSSMEQLSKNLGSLFDDMDSVDACTELSTMKEEYKRLAEEAISIFLTARVLVIRVLDLCFH